METTRPNWEERYAKLSPDDIKVDISFAIGLMTVDESHRMVSKVNAVRQLAKELILGMLKGTYKYEHDNRTPEEWAEFEDDEFNDIINYKLLRKAAEDSNV